MLTTIALSALALTGAALAQNTATSVAAVDAAAATAKTSSPTSHVKGKVFDRIAIIWLENTDYAAAAADPNMAALAKQGITLSNLFGQTHPSEPNYAATAGGDNFGMDNDNLNFLASNVSNVVDLLENKGISWAAYQQHLPYSGFEGYSWVNQNTSANDYVRKHNPPILYTDNYNEQRLSQIKNFTMFEKDLAENKLPQWMFITPNMTNDGHDTSVTVAGQWSRDFIEPLLKNKNFMDNTLILLTFDENETYTIGNRVFSILLGDVIPKHLEGTTDSTFYNHYSELATVEANWGLHTLGRWDVGANVFNIVAECTGDRNSAWPAATDSHPTRFFNQSFAGPFNSVKAASYPVPNTSLVRNGRTVLPSIQQQWGSRSLQKNTYYKNTVQVPDGLNPPPGWAN